MGQHMTKTMNLVEESIVEDVDDSLIDPEKKCEDIIKKYQGTIDKLEQQCLKRSVYLIELKDKIEVEAEKNDFKEVSKMLRKQFFREKEMERQQRQIKLLKKVRLENEDKYKELKGYEKYDEIMVMIQDPQLSTILEHLLKDELFLKSKLKPVQTDEKLYSYEERAEWVKKELKRMKKKVGIDESSSSSSSDEEGERESSSSSSSEEEDSDEGNGKDDE